MHGALSAELVGDHGLRPSGTWSIIGKLPEWDPTNWPMPVFGGGSSEMPFRYLVDYPTPSARPHVTRVAPDRIAGLPRDGFSPSRAAELGLSALLRSGHLPALRIEPSMLSAASTTDPLRRTEATDDSAEEAVRVYFDATSQMPGRQVDAMTEWENSVDRHLRNEKLGYVDGNEVDADEWVTYLYGPSRREVWEAVRPMIHLAPLKAFRAFLRVATIEAEPEVVPLP